MKKIIIIMISIILLLFSYRIIDLRYINYDKYQELYNIKNELIVYGNNAPRGRILDRNGNVLVDNSYGNNIVYYKNTKYINNEIDIADKLREFIDIEINTDKIKDYYLLEHNSEELLSDEELHDYEYRIIDSNDIYELKKSRITDDMLNIYDEDKRKSIMIYYLMNNGYFYEGKVLSKDVSNEVCALVIESKIEGVTCEKYYKREYKYEELRSILGSVSYIPKEEVDYYLDKGYQINDLVGISGLEKYYDEYLQGEKGIYKVNDDFSLELVKEEKQGNDLVLSLDIDLINSITKILEEEMISAKSKPNTSYFRDSYIIVSDVKTSNIVAIKGLQILGESTYSFKDVTNNIFTSSFTVGSVVKGASHTVGYLNNAIQVGKKIKDSCVKLYNVPAKCSFKDLGYIDDIGALKMSSNYFQFKTVINVLGKDYKSNMKLDVTEDDFSIYRDIFKEYGLGSKTNIDYPIENTGIVGEKISADLLLNLSIGQYDTYSALGLLSYINTIANYGERKSLSLALKDNEVLNNINLDKDYYDRIIEGFYQVVNEGTGLGYTPKEYNAVGKTGTSQTYYSKDIMTITQSYVMYAPRDNPKYSMVVIIPNVSITSEDGTEYMAPVNRLISKRVSKLLFAE